MNEGRREIYKNRDKVFEKELVLLEKEDISKKNKEIIRDFQNYKLSNSKQMRAAKLSSQMRAICRWLKFNLKCSKSLDELNQKDAINLVAFINRLEKLSETTRADYRRGLKQFYRWFKKEDNRLTSKQERRRVEGMKFYEFLEEVRIGYPLIEADPNVILTEENIDLVIEKGCTNPRDKAFVKTLHESAMRSAEMLNLRTGDVIIKDGFAEINVPNGKTGKRVVFVRDSLPYLIRYLDVHPFKDDMSSYLWLSNSQDSTKKNKPLMHIGARRLVDRCFERAGLNKRHNLHWFRHSRATILAPQVSESVLCKFMGWTLGSRQVRTYVHLCNKQVRDVFLSLKGLKEEEKNIAKPIKCLCGSLNSPSERYCFKCFKPLKMETVVQDQNSMNSEIGKTMDFFMQMAKNPELMKKFEEFSKDSS